MRKVKFASGAAVLFCLLSLGQSYLVESKISWDAQDDWLSEEEVEFPKGRIHYYSKNTEVCNR